MSYRRIPVVAIGNDVYCDTGLISNALERRFPSSAGYGTIFPPRKGGKADTGMIKAFAQSYPEKTLFPLAVALLPWQKFPESFVKDRSEVRIQYTLSLLLLIQIFASSLEVRQSMPTSWLHGGHT